MHKCFWKHCSYGGYITDVNDEVTVGKHYYHKACANERQIIDDIITKFIEQVNPAEIPVLRRVVNEIVFSDTKPVPAEYVMFALDYAITHPEVKLMYPQGLYRVCNSIDVLNAWKEHLNKQFMKTVDESKFVAEEVETTTLNKPKSSKGFGSILWQGRKTVNGQV